MPGARKAKPKINGPTRTKYRAEGYDKPYTSPKYERNEARKWLKMATQPGSIGTEARKALEVAKPKDVLYKPKGGRKK